MIDNQGITYSQLLNKVTLLNFSISAERVLEILISYSFLIFQGQDGNLYFNYRENPEIGKIDKENLTLTLPKCIYHYYRRLN